MLLLRSSSFNKNKIRKQYSQKIILKNSFDEKFEFYQQLQKFFFNAEFLVHFDKNQILYIDINVFKKRDFETMIYHLKFHANFKKLRKINVESIFFLSRLFNFIKTRS